eukprot:Nk52_evm1s2109 gene=Nk52_evmTU1s2109
MSCTGESYELIWVCIHSTGLSQRAAKSLPLEEEQVMVRFGEEFGRKESNLADATISSVWEDRVKKNSRLFDMSKFRLDSAVVISGSTGEDCCLQLNVGVTSYKEFQGTNKAPREVAEQLARDGKREYQNSNAFFSDTLGISSIVACSDGNIVLQKRSIHVGEYPEYFDVPGGHAEPSEVAENCTLPGTRTYENLNGLESKIKHEIFSSSTKEICDEINIPLETLSQPKLLGIIRNKETWGKPNALFLHNCSLTFERVREYYNLGAKESFESTEIKGVHASCLEVEQHTIPLTPAASASIALFLKLHTAHSP